MPFVNIRIVEGHSQQRKDEMAKRISAAISEVTEIPRDNIWIVFEDVSSDKWYVGGETVTRLRQQK
jgi:4-oxalocrotonate tautomerase